eukprot:scaffold61831_cov28-Tisochrysis_lutea.AAC.3
MLLSAHTPLTAAARGCARGDNPGSTAGCGSSARRRRRSAELSVAHRLLSAAASAWIKAARRCPPAHPCEGYQRRPKRAQFAHQGESGAPERRCAASP